MTSSLDPSTTHPLPRGFVLDGEYVIDDVLGVGGFAITYLAHPARLPGKSVAIKEFFPKGIVLRARDGAIATARGSAQAQDIFDWGLSRFREEGRNVYEISNDRQRHPHIVLVERIFDANNTTYMVMEYVEGQTLEAHIAKALAAKAPLEEEWLLGLLDKMLSALEEIHSARKLHRDIKPANIIIRPTEEHLPHPVLIDFGSARDDTTAPTLSSDTTHHTIVVSPGYAPIEQERAGNQGPYTDIYGLAATLYHAMFLSKPIGSSIRWNAMQVARTDGTYYLEPKRDPLHAAMSRGKGGYSKALLGFIDRGLDIEPRRRPASVAQWRSQFGIQPAMRSKGTGARVAKRLGRIALAASLLIVSWLGWNYWQTSTPSAHISSGLNALSHQSFTLSTVNQAVSHFAAAAARDPTNEKALAGGNASNALLDVLDALRHRNLPSANAALTLAERSLTGAGADSTLLEPARERVRDLALELDHLRRINAAGLGGSGLADLRVREEERALNGKSMPTSIITAREHLEAAAKALAQDAFANALRRIDTARTALAAYPDEFQTFRVAREEVERARIRWADAEEQRLVLQLKERPISVQFLRDIRSQSAPVLEAAPDSRSLRALASLATLLARSLARDVAFTKSEYDQAFAYASAANLPPDWLDARLSDLQEMALVTELQRKANRLATEPFDLNALLNAKRAGANVIAASRPESPNWQYGQGVAALTQTLLLAREAIGEGDFETAKAHIAAGAAKLSRARLGPAVEQRANKRLLEETTKTSAVLLAEARTILSSANAFARRGEAAKLYQRAQKLNPDEPASQLGSQVVKMVDLIAQARTDQELSLAWELLDTLRVGIERLSISSQLAEDVERNLSLMTRRHAKNIFESAFSKAAEAKLNVATVDGLHKELSRSQALVNLIGDEKAMQAYGTFADGVQSLRAVAYHHERYEQSEASVALRKAKPIFIDRFPKSRSMFSSYEAAVSRGFRVEPIVEATLSEADGIHLLERSQSRMRERRFNAAKADLGALRDGLADLARPARNGLIQPLARIEARWTQIEAAARARSGPWLYKGFETLSGAPKDPAHLAEAKEHIQHVLDHIHADLPEALSAKRAIDTLQMVVESERAGDPGRASTALANAKANIEAWLGYLPDFIDELTIELGQ
ncbi:MAG: serine/threonine-protein kinase [Pseudomonadota bacterium]